MTWYVPAGVVAKFARRLATPLVTVVLPKLMVGLLNVTVPVGVGAPELLRWTVKVESNPCIVVAGDARKDAFGRTLQKPKVSDSVAESQEIAGQRSGRINDSYW